MLGAYTAVRAVPTAQTVEVGRLTPRPIDLETAAVGRRAGRSVVGNAPPATVCPRATRTGASAWTPRAGTLMPLHPLVLATGGGACTSCGGCLRIVPFMGRHRAIPRSTGQLAKHCVPVGGITTATRRREVQVQDPSLVIHARRDIEASSHAPKDRRPAGVAMTIVAVNAALVLVSAPNHGWAQSIGPSSFTFRLPWSASWRASTGSSGSAHALSFSC